MQDKGLFYIKTGENGDGLVESIYKGIMVNDFF